MSRARLLLGLLVSFGLVWLLLSAASLSGLVNSLRGADYTSLVPATAVFFLGVGLRSWRWKLLLDPVARLPVGRLFRAMVIGFTVNNLLPARLGEIARAVLLSRWSGVAPATTIGTLVVERLFDGLTLCALLALTFVWLAPNDWLRGVALLAGAAMGIGGTVVVMAAVVPQRFLLLGQRGAKLLPERYRARALRLCAGFLDGLAVVRRPRTLLSVTLLSLLAWLTEASMYYLIMRGFDLDVPPLGALLGMVVANLGTMIPSSPGYIGTFDYLLQRVLVDLFGVSVDLATSFTLVVHAALIIPVVVLGLYLLSREGLSLREVSRRSAARPLALSRSTDPAGRAV